jgi:uncharacterized membrane protein
MFGNSRLRRSHSIEKAPGQQGGKSPLRRVLGLALAITVAAVALPGRAAHADLTFTSHYGSKVYVAFASSDATCPGATYYDRWRVKGWYAVEPGQLITVLVGTVAQKEIFWYAESADRKAVWAGSWPFPVTPSAFDHCSVERPDGGELRFFSDIHIGDYYIFDIALQP